MRSSELTELLQAVASGDLDPEAAAARLAPTADLGFANLDIHREARSGLPEAVLGEGKSLDELIAITDKLIEVHGRVLVTRLDQECAAELSRRHQEAEYHQRSEVWTCGPTHDLDDAKGRRSVAIVSAGTSDRRVAEEAAVVVEWHGLTVRPFEDVGIAGVHRLLDRLEEIRKLPVVIVVAGMDGALPTLVAGLVKSVVIAVPTSVGYGASFEGLAALLTMLNGCAPGISVVNIDNGYGAAVCACRILGLNLAYESREG